MDAGRRRPSRPDTTTTQPTGSCRLFSERCRMAAQTLCVSVFMAFMVIRG